ncbi:hypothetical protein B0H16DRAFT_1325416 [Mycena metata]|uniref:Uncharacterized protein n=1 Tax=Mycena metata TaxID=1033252 RepID=A0AAD7N032_9AGAR|nr:hypothetical protein B0H16DRAFT_1325416 [Mycena metata]
MCSPQRVLTISRISCRIEPFIYKRLSFVSTFGNADPVPRFLATIDSRPSKFFAVHVKHLYFDHTMPLYFVRKVLSVCTGVVVLGCPHSYRSLAPLIAPLPLQRFLVRELTLPSAPKALPRWTASLTHLGVSGSTYIDAHAYAALPTLIHLAVDAHCYAVSYVSPARILYACPRGRCLIAVTQNESESRSLLEHLHAEGFTDPRCYVHLRARLDGTWDGWSRRLPDMFWVTENCFCS